MSVDELYAETNNRIDKRMRSDPQLLALQARQQKLAEQINQIAVAAEKRIEVIVAEEIKKTFQRIKDGKEG